MSNDRYRRIVPLPLTPDVWAELAVFTPMTTAEWTQMIRTLDAMRQGLVDVTPPPDPACADAEGGERG